MIMAVDIGGVASLLIVEGYDCVRVSFLVSCMRRSHCFDDLGVDGSVRCKRYVQSDVL